MRHDATTQHDPDIGDQDVPFAEPLTADEAARVMGFRGADAEYRAWLAACNDPRRRGPPPAPPYWRTRIPGWDIMKPDGGVRLTADGTGWIGAPREDATDGPPAVLRFLPR